MSAAHMAERDYYETLGVARDASADQIRAAYRALARKFHPDVNKSPDATAKFSEVQRAYDVLGDETKRRLFDQYGVAGVEGGAPPPPRGRARPGGAPGTPHTVGDFDPEELSEIFESFFGRGSGGFGTRPGEGGPGGPRGGRGRATPRAEPEPVRADVTVPFVRAAVGGPETVGVRENGRTKRIEVRIPAGVEDGATLRMRGALGGAKSPQDLILTVRVSPHPLWRRGEGASEGKGLDLFVDLPLTVAEAFLGATVTVPTPGGPVDLQVPALSGSGRRLRLRGRGIRDDEGREGDLYAVLRIVAPGALTDEDKAALIVLGEKTLTPRSGPEWRTT
ncbi:MAG: DnaJ C-terminal domain-containing protein [Planctomycetota bacterium]|nr:DnaJ C-terminal domain-containing protein [Planctomycetota bacterium]